LPMSDDRVETRVAVELGRQQRNFGGLPAAPGTAWPAGGPGGSPSPGAEPVELAFQEYFVGLRHSVEVKAVRFAGVELSRPAPGVLEAIDQADLVVICPSNPVVSIGPVAAVPGVAEALGRRRETTVAVSPIVAGRALKGPADRMLTELGHEASVAGVARLWSPLAGTLVVDPADADSAARVQAEGMRCVITASVMTGPAEAAHLARAVLAAGAGR